MNKQSFRQTKPLSRQHQQMSDYLDENPLPPTDGHLLTSQPQQPVSPAKPLATLEDFFPIYDTTTTNKPATKP